MKITKSQLKRVIKEELKRVLQEKEINYTPAGEEIGFTSLPYDPLSGRSINQAFRRGDISRDEWRTARRAEWNLNKRGRPPQSRPQNTFAQDTIDQLEDYVGSMSDLSPATAEELPVVDLTQDPRFDPLPTYRQSDEDIESVLKYPEMYPAAFQDLVDQGHPEALNPQGPPEVPVPEEY